MIAQTQYVGMGFISQEAINREMAKKYGAERQEQNQDMMFLYESALNDWERNGQRGPAPTAPALFETNEEKLFQFFNSGEVGILTTNGVINYNAADGRDPLQVMFNAGNTNNPLYNGSQVYGSSGYNPTYDTFNYGGFAMAAQITAPGRSGNIFQVGDTWSVKITGGTPNTPVTWTALLNGASKGSGSQGSTDSLGNYYFSGVFQPGDIGQWNQEYKTGSRKASLQFAVNGKPASGTVATGAANQANQNNTGSNTVPSGSGTGQGSNNVPTGTDIGTTIGDAISNFTLFSPMGAAVAIGAYLLLKGGKKGR